DRYWVIEEHHDAVARELVERSFELAHERPQSAMVLTQELQHLLRLGSFGEGGVAAQVAEHDDDFAAMAFEDLLVTLRDDQLRQLWCQESFQAPDPAQLTDLLRNPRFETAVEFGYFLGALAQLVEQPSVLHRDDRLRGKVLQQGDLLVGEWAHLHPVHYKAPDDVTLLQ